MTDLFNSLADEELWLKLNAEHQIAWEKGLTWFNKETQQDGPTLQARKPRTFEKALEIAKNQLQYDKEQGKLRHSLEDYLLLSTDELNHQSDLRHKEWITKFEAL